MLEKPKNLFERVIALIPARKGSKGLANKNMRHLCNKPLIDYTLRAALNSKYVSETWVSSDCTKTLGYSKILGAKGLVRPKLISRDESSSATVVEHFISTFEKTSETKNTLIAFLQPTSPMRTSEHIDSAIEQMRKNESSQLISVRECRESPFKSITIDENNRAKPLMKKNFSNHRRQDLATAYIPNGAMYFFTIDFFLNYGSFPFEGSDTYIMSSDDSIDIDGEKDLHDAERLITGRVIETHLN